MNVLFVILTVIALIASVLLTIVVLLQNGKGGGLASNFTAGNQTFGVRQTADILEKITWGLVVVIFVITIVASFATGNSSKSGDDITGEVENYATEQLPEFGTPSTPAEGTMTLPAEGETPATPAE
ncbi:MAG: preprotein translocase subunit SecG [Bacteroidales bacterium]|nr:preprotein translocase subunit SecG [Bacteroidales bacterium]